MYTALMKPKNREELRKLGLAFLIPPGGTSSKTASLDRAAEMREASLDKDGDQCQISPFKDLGYYMAFDFKDLEFFLDKLTWPDKKKAEYDSMGSGEAKAEKLKDICYALELVMQLLMTQSKVLSESQGFEARLGGKLKQASAKATIV